MTDTFALSLFFFTITIILTIYAIEKIFPSRNTKTRTGVDAYTQKPFIHQYSDPDPEPKPTPEPEHINPKLVTSIVASYEKYGVHITPSDIDYLHTLQTPNDVHRFIDINYISRK